MRLLSCFLFTILCGFWATCTAQPDTSWTQRFEMGDGVTLYGAAEIAGGGYAVAGAVTQAGVQDIFVARLSGTGSVVWSRSFGIPDSAEQANAVVELSNGDLMLIGQRATAGQPSRTFLVMGVSANGDSLWTQAYRPGGRALGSDALTLSDGSVAALGYKLGTDGAHSDLWLLKLTATGDTVWTRLFGGSDTDTGSRLLPRSGGGFLIAGQTKSSGQGDYDFWLLQTDSAGNQISTETYGTASVEKCNGMAVRSGSVFLGGRIAAVGGTDNDAYLVKRNAAGQLLWSRVYTAGNDEEQISAVIARPGGGALCAGWTGAATGYVHPWIFRVNDEGTLEQSWVDTTCTQGQFWGMMPLATGGGLAWGQITAGGITQGYAVRLAPTGEACGVIRRQDNSHPIANVLVAASGTTSLTSAAGHYSLDLVPGTYLLNLSGPCIARQTVQNVRVSQDSSTVVDMSVGSPDFECDRTSVNAVVQNHVATVSPLTIYNTGSGELEFRVSVESSVPDPDWLSAVPSSGLILEGDSLQVSVQILTDTLDNGVFDYDGSVVIHTYACPDSVRRIPVFAMVLDAPVRHSAAYKFGLSPAYPNPFNPVTTLSFSLPNDALVRLAVFDVTGREVAVLASTIQSAGEHHVAFDGSTLSSGVYFVRMQCERFNAMQKIMLLK